MQYGAGNEHLDGGTVGAGLLVSVGLCSVASVGSFTGSVLCLEGEATLPGGP